MENAATMNILLNEIGLVLQGMVDAGYREQFARIIFNINSDFHINFPEGKNFFALFVESGMLKYYAFDTIAEAENALDRFKKMGDTAQYRVVPRSVAEMFGREHEFHQYREMMADSDEAAAEYASRQKEIINFIFASK